MIPTQPGLGFQHEEMRGIAVFNRTGATVAVGDCVMFAPDLSDDDVSNYRYNDPNSQWTNVVNPTTNQATDFLRYFAIVEDLGIDGGVDNSRIYVCMIGIVKATVADAIGSETTAGRRLVPNTNRTLEEGSGGTGRVVAQTLEGAVSDPALVDVFFDGYHYHGVEA